MFIRHKYLIILVKKSKTTFVIEAFYKKAVEVRTRVSFWEIAESALNTQTQVIVVWLNSEIII